MHDLALRPWWSAGQAAQMCGAIGTQRATTRRSRDDARRFPDTRCDYALASGVAEMGAERATCRTTRALGFGFFRMLALATVP
jgi:hypothetical protein